MKHSNMDGDALDKLALRYHGNIIKHYKAILYYEIAIEKGNTDAMIHYALFCEGEQHNYDDAIIYYNMAIEKGNSNAMTKLALYYENELKNYDEAIKYYNMAIEKGNVSAMINLALYYEKKIENYEEAIKYYEMSIANGEFSKDFNFYYDKTDLNLDNTLSSVLDFMMELTRLDNDQKLKYYKLLKSFPNMYQYTHDDELGTTFEFKLTCDEYEKLCDTIEEQQKEIDDLKTHIKYAPEGDGYKEAKEEFERLTIVQQQ